MEIPKVDAIFTGTGDLFASLLLAWLYRHPDDLALACEATVSTVQAVLTRTLAHAQRKSSEMWNILRLSWTMQAYKHRIGALSLLKPTQEKLIMNDTTTG